jgi:hypothetical protein
VSGGDGGRVVCRKVVGIRETNRVVLRRMDEVHL